MNYVDSFNLFGLEAAQIPCIKGAGAPTTTTEGAVGCFYMNTDNGDVYKCTAVAYGVYTWVNDSYTEAVEQDIKVLRADIDTIAIKDPNQLVNLFNKDSDGVIDNYFLGSNTEDMTVHKETALKGYYISDYIPVEEGKQYTTNRDGSGFKLTATSGPCVKSFWYYDENKEPLSRPVGEQIGDTQYYTSMAPAGAKYARIDFFNGSVTMFVEGATLPDSYVAYDPDATPQKVLILPHTKEYTQTVINPLYCKTIIFAGDSICEGYNYGDTEDAYAGRIANKNNMTYKNFGVSGSTLTEKLAYYASGSEKPSISSRIDAMYAEFPNADYIIIEGGTNDADLLGSHINGATVERFGTFTTNDFSGNYNRETFCGALESIFYRATQYWKGKKIGYIVAHKMGVSNSGYGADVHNRRNYFETAITICNKWGIPVLNLWDDCYLNPSLSWMNAAGATWEEKEAAGSLYVDGQHLLSAGYNYIADIINNWLKSM